MVRLREEEPEAELVDRFGVSRITIGRAVRDLQPSVVDALVVMRGSYSRSKMPAAPIPPPTHIETSP